MPKESPSTFSSLYLALFLVGLTVSLISGCAVSAESAKSATAEKTARSSKTSPEKSDSPANLTKNSSFGNRIQITTGSPADAVRVFYKNLREKRFREAMLMTNLRAGIENLSEAEMQDLSADFEPLAAEVPAELEINGEIITNNQATVTAKMPDEDGKVGLKEIRLRRENDSWVLLTADEKEEAAAKRQGKEYFFQLRIETHHSEAQKMMEQIARAQMVSAMQNKGAFSDMPTLVASKMLPDQAAVADAIGYRFNIVLSADKKKYFATAEPSVYGKSGKLSYLLESSATGEKPRLKAADKKGMPLKK